MFSPNLKKQFQERPIPGSEYVLLEDCNRNCSLDGILLGLAWFWRRKITEKGDRLLKIGLLVYASVEMVHLIVVGSIM